MGFFNTIILTLLIQLGFFCRLAYEGECCPQAGMEHTHLEASCHHDDSDHPAPVCAAEVQTSDLGNCPSDCTEHHHHHGTCIHSMQLSHIVDSHCRLAPPHSLMMGCDWLHMRVPDGPVFEMDKPPLI